MIRKIAAHCFILSLLAAPIVAQSIASRAAYDRATETSIAGVIVGVDAYPGADGVVGVHLEVNTGREFVQVHVGPAIYLGANNFFFFADERVSVIGSRVSTDARTAIWARTIAKGPSMLVLRNENGTPKWTPAADGADGCGVSHASVGRTTTTER
jgi:hypothetical protein